MFRQSKMMRWWPLLACLVLAGGLLAIEVELPVAPAWHMALQIAIIVLVYGLVAWWCYLDDRDRTRQASEAHRILAYRDAPVPTATTPEPVIAPATGHAASRQAEVSEVKLRPVPMVRRPGGSDSLAERNN